MEIIALVVLAVAVYLLLPKRSALVVVPPDNPSPSPAAPTQGQRATYPEGTTPTWSPADVKALIDEICAEENYGRPQLAKAIARTESSFDPRAVNPGDHAPTDAVDQGDSAGLMGLKVPTARAYVPWVESIEDLYDPFTNVRAGVRFLKDLEIKYAGTYALEGVVQIYNLGETRFLKGERSPDYLARVRAFGGLA